MTWEFTIVGPPDYPYIDEMVLIALVCAWLIDKLIAAIIHEDKDSK